MSLQISQPPLGLGFDTVDCTARNEHLSGTDTISAGDVVVFDTFGLGTTPGDSIDPTDANYYFGVIRDTPDVATGSAAEDTASNVNAYGIYGIALEDIAFGESGLVRVQGFVQANVQADETLDTTAIAAGDPLGPCSVTLLDHDILHATSDCAIGTKVIAFALEAAAADNAIHKIWVLLDGIHPLGVMR